MQKFVKSVFALAAVAASAMACTYTDGNNSDNSSNGGQNQTGCQIKCKQTQYCNEGQCVEKAYAGGKCETNSQCLSNSCVGYECTCTEDAGCRDTQYCVTSDGNSACQDKKIINTSCGNKIECLSNACENGKCAGCVKSSDCGSGKVCDAGVCRQTEPCPDNASKKCFLDTSMAISASSLSGTTSIVDPESFIGTSFRPIMSFDKNTFTTCRAPFDSPVIGALMKGEDPSEIDYAELKALIIEYINTHPYAQELFFEYFVNDIMPYVAIKFGEGKEDNEIRANFDTLKVQYVAIFNKYFYEDIVTGSGDKVDISYVWNKSIEHMITMCKRVRPDAEISEEEVTEAFLKRSLEVVMDKLKTDLRFLNRWDDNCFEFILNQPTQLTLEFGDRWRNNNFQVVFTVADAPLSGDKQIVNNKYFYSAAPDYASPDYVNGTLVMTDIGTPYARRLQFPMALTSSDFGKETKDLIIRYEAEKCNSTKMIKNSKLEEVPTCDAGFRQVHLKVSYANENSFSCENYYTMTKLCESAKCDKNTIASLPAAQKETCKPSGFMQFRRMKVYIELTDDDLK